MNRNGLFIPDCQTITGGRFGSVDGDIAFHDLDPHAAFRGYLMYRLLIFEQRPAVQLHILVNLQRTVTRIRRQHQLFALRGIKATLLVAWRNAVFLRDDPNLIQMQFLGVAWVVLRVTDPRPGAHNLEFTCRYLLFITHAVLMLHRTFQYVGQDFHVFMGMRTKALACVNHVIVNHAQCREPHEIRVIVVGKRKGMPGIEPAMICMTTVVCFA